MSYLKIFPLSIIVKPNAAGGFVGQLAYDFEHYGRMLYGEKSDVGIDFVCQRQTRWLIFSRETTHQLNGFVVFMGAMNHYLFQVLQFDPASQWTNVSANEYEYHFERVYFDMSTRQFKPFSKSR